MDWQSWVDAGWIVPVEDGGVTAALPKIRAAWQQVIASRAAYLKCDWEETDGQLRLAFLTANDALLTVSGYRAIREFDFEDSVRLGCSMFGENLIGGMRERACILRSMMPLPDKISDAEARRVRRSVAASSEYVAMVESQIMR